MVDSIWAGALLIYAERGPSKVSFVPAASAGGFGAGHVHVLETHDLGVVDELEAQIEDQDQNHAEVGHGHVRPVQAEQGGDVLSGNDDDAEHHGQDRAQRVELGVILELAQVVPLELEGPPEAEVAQGDADPGDEPGQSGGGHQPHVEGLAEDAGGEGGQGHADRGYQGRQGDAPLGGPGEDGRSIVVLGQSVEHAAGCIGPGVDGREDGCQHHRVHDAGCRGQAGPLEDQGEWRHGDVPVRGSQKVGAGVGDQGGDDEDGEHIEEQDPPEDIVDGLGDRLAGVFGFSGGHAHYLGALEGIAGDQEDAHDGWESSHEWSILVGEVLQADRWLEHDSADHGHADDQEDNDGGHLDQGEPELGLSECGDRQGVDQEDDDQDQQAPDPSWGVGQPVLDQQGGGGDVHGTRDGPVQPVVPAHGEAQGRIHVAGAVGGEGSRHRKVCGQLAQAGHQEVDHDAHGYVGQKSAAGAGCGDGGAGGHEQSGADAAAQGDHGDVAGLEVALDAAVAMMLLPGPVGLIGVRRCIAGVPRHDPPPFGWATHRGVRGRAEIAISDMPTGCRKDSIWPGP